MVSKVEEVAAAIHAAFVAQEGTGHVDGVDMVDADGVTIDGHFDLLAVATAAIKALRVPNDVMIEAGQQVAVDSAAFDAADEVEVFNAMIDAALKEKTPAG